MAIFWRAISCLLIAFLLCNCAREHFSENGEPTPAVYDVSLKSLNGAEVSLVQYRHQVLVLTFSASWCSMCKDTLNQLSTLANDFSTERLKFIVIGVGDSPEKLESFMQKSGFSLSVLGDQNGELAEIFGIEGLPTTIVIGPDGKQLELMDPKSGQLVNEIVGPINWRSEIVIDRLRELEMLK